MSTSKGNSQYTNRNAIGYGPEANILPEIYADEMYGYGNGAPYYTEPNFDSLGNPAPGPVINDPGPVFDPSGHRRPDNGKGSLKGEGGGGLAGGGTDPNPSGGSPHGYSNPGGIYGGNVTAPTAAERSASITGTTGADNWLPPSGAGVQFDPNANATYTHGPGGNSQFANLESLGLPALERMYGTPDTWGGSAYGRNDLGQTTYNGLTFTGAQHELGGNPDIAQWALDNGMSPEDFARFLIQGETDNQNVNVLGPGATNSQLVAAGVDRFGNPLNLDQVGTSTARLGPSGGVGYTSPGGMQATPQQSSGPALPSGVVVGVQQPASDKGSGRVPRDVGDRGGSGNGGNGGGGGGNPPPGGYPPSGTPPPTTGGGGGGGYQRPPTTVGDNRPPGTGNETPRWTTGGPPASNNPVPRVPPVGNPGTGGPSNPPPITVGQRNPIIPGPGAPTSPTGGRPFDRSSWASYDFGSGGASGNRNAAGEGAFSGYAGLVNNPNVDPQIQQQMRLQAAKDAEAQYGGAADQILRTGAATGATAGNAAALASLGRSQAETLGTNERNLNISLEQERQRRLEAGLSGLSNMYGTETGYLGNLIAGRAGAAYKPRLTGGQGQSQGSGGSLDFGSLLGMLGG